MKIHLHKLEIKTREKSSLKKTTKTPVNDVENICVYEPMYT